MAANQSATEKVNVSGILSFNRVAMSVDVAENNIIAALGDPGLDGPHRLLSERDAIVYSLH